jgi:hypothetical protein
VIILPTLKDLGLWSFLGGLLILLVYGAGKILATAETPLLIRVGILGMVVGFVILLLTLIKEQYKEDS